MSDLKTIKLPEDDVRIVRKSLAREISLVAKDYVDGEGPLFSPYLDELWGLIRTLENFR